MAVGIRQNRRRLKVFARSLGCPKNRVDTELILGDMLSHGYDLVTRAEDADVIIVNTCGFLEEAREESLSTLEEVARRKRPDAILVSAGCMGDLFRDLIRSRVPEVKIVAGAQDTLRIRALLEGDVFAPPRPPCASDPRLVTSGPVTAYLKVADGCSRRCTFCIIPKLRGRQRSRDPDDIVEEAKALARIGIREVVLVAQDLTHYGSDLPSRPDIATLVERLEQEVKDLRWIRLMYLYPRDIPERLLELVANSSKILHYFDIPVQHADDRVLSAMKRGTSASSLRRLVAKIRAKVPGAVLRTTYMVGFPGETEEAFENLLSFARETRFEFAGVFRFSREPLCAAARLEGQVEEKVARARERRLQRVLSEIAGELAFEGQVHEAVVEGRLGKGRLRGRFWFQAPEVDGDAILKGPNVAPGTFVKAVILGRRDTTFIGQVVGEE